ncbi:MAG: cytochrome b [Alphaproteobacteria bacterium]
MSESNNPYRDFIDPHTLAEPFEPQNKLLQWTESRLPIVNLVYNAGVSFPSPRNLNYFWTFGMILMFMLVFQIATGVVLVMHYAPNTDLAFASVEHIMRDVNYGWLLRYAHANGASFFFIAVYIHILRGLYYGSYKAPREILWILGVAIYLVMMATGFMGYVLPWGQMSLWGVTVITNLFSAIPLVGDALTTLLWGGFSVDNPALNRFFSLHYLLPFVLAGLVVLHVWALHIPGNNNPLGVDIKGKQDTLPFWPYYTIKDMYALVLFLVVFMAFVFFLPNAMGHPDNYIEANPMVTPPHIVPEWYYLPFYAILRSTPDILFIPAKLAGVIAMFGGIAIWALLPWLDTSKVRSGNFRPLFQGFFVLFLIDLAFLGWLGAQVPTDTLVLLGQIGTLYYFGFFFVILPVLGLVEKPKPLPASISEAVLPKGDGNGGGGAPEGAAAQAEKRA